MCFYTGCGGERWGDQEDPGGGPEDPAESGGAAGWGEGIYTGESGKWGPSIINTGSELHEERIQIKKLYEIIQHWLCGNDDRAFYLLLK